MEVEVQLDKWETKFNALCSSPSRPNWHSFVKGTKQVLTQSELQSSELCIHQEKRREEQEKKLISQRVVQKMGGLTARDAQQILDGREQKEKEKEAKRQQRKALSI
jgi:fructose-specific phosphotransferase system component IIB